MDTLTLIATIVGSILASSGLWAVIQTLINKKTGKEQDLKDIKDQLAELKQDNIEALAYREERQLLEEQRLAAQKVEQEAIISAQRGLIKERLLENYNKCLSKGFYTRDEREVYEELFERYESAPFNGNGVIHDLHSLMRELPWEKPS